MRIIWVGCASLMMEMRNAYKIITGKSGGEERPL
jgi:hypothetical protein